MNTIVFVPALKSNSVFQNDLLIKINGKTLIQRVIEKAKQFGVTQSSIHIFTDSEEVGLCGERLGVTVFVDKEVVNSGSESQTQFLQYCRDNISSSDIVLRLSPYAPLIDVNTLQKARLSLDRLSVDGVVGVVVARVGKSDQEMIDVESELCPAGNAKRRIRSTAFAFIRGAVIKGSKKQKEEFCTIDVGSDVFEIDSHEDWWVCEKLLSRKRIVFRVIGNEYVGMGHIYRALTLAHEIIDHEIIFVTDEDNKDAVNKLTDYDYRLEIYDRHNIVTRIADLMPDLVINDILDTREGDVSLLQDCGARVMNFEDLGEGSTLANITINELYDIPYIEGENIRWGMEYFFVRDEFEDATPCDFRRQPKALLLAFGGVDQHDLTRKILFTIEDVCRSRDVHIYIVTGPGYSGYNKLAKEIEDMNWISLTHATGIISKIMENVSLAITSNGRTVYEMAHMNIPALVIPQHEREKTHQFACEDNGFIQFEPYEANVTEQKVLMMLERMLDDPEYREGFHKKTLRHQFSENKRRVIDLIRDQLEDS